MKEAKGKRTDNVSVIERISQRKNNLLGNNIKRLRLERGLRNRDVICKLQLQGIEIYFGTYSKLEAGKFNSTVDMIMALTQVFQCGYEELLREQK